MPTLEGKMSSEIRTNKTLKLSTAQLEVVLGGLRKYIDDNPDEVTTVGRLLTEVASKGVVGQEIWSQLQPYLIKAASENTLKVVGEIELVLK
jgi:hypothetical protein